MKRFVVLFTSLVLSIPVIGCGGGDGATSTTSSSEDQSTWGEARKHKAKVEAEQAARVQQVQTQKVQKKKR